MHLHYCKTGKKYYESDKLYGEVRSKSGRFIYNSVKISGVAALRLILMSHNVFLLDFDPSPVVVLPSKYKTAQFRF